MPNGNVIGTASNGIGSSLGQVTSIELGRMPRVAFQHEVLSTLVLVPEQEVI